MAVVVCGKNNARQSLLQVQESLVGLQCRRNVSGSLGSYISTSEPGGIHVSKRESAERNSLCSDQVKHWFEKCVCTNTGYT